MELKDILAGLKIKADIERVEANGTTTKVYLKLHPSAKVSRIENCSTEIGLGTGSFGKPIVRVLMEQGLVCIELLNAKVQQVNFSEFDSLFPDKIKKMGELPIILGRQHSGEDLIIDLAQAPHILLAGATGMGKSTLLHSIICSIIKTNSARLVLIDGKEVELKTYQNIRQLLYPVVSLAPDALEILDDLILEMNDRFSLLGRKEVNNIKAYNEANDPLPYIVAIIDEFSTLQMSGKKDFQDRVQALANKSRAAGIHMLLSTQRPSVDIITGVLKSNMPVRIALKTSSAIDSRIILDHNNAERLLGRGDALLSGNRFDLLRFQGAYISAEEIAELCLKNKRKGKSWLENLL